MAKLVYSFISGLLSNPIAKGSAIIFSGTMLMNISAYLYHLVVGRMMGPVQYGELASLYSLSYLLNVPANVIQNVIAKYVSGYFAKNEDGKTKRLLIVATKRLSIFSFAFCLVAIPLYPQIANYLHIDAVWLVGIMVLSSAVFFISTIVMGVLQGYQKFSDVVVFGNISAFLRLAGGGIGSMFGVGPTVLANLFTTIFGYFLSLFPLRFLFRKKEVLTNLSTKEITSYGIPSMVSIFGLTSLYSADIILVKHFFNSFDAGIYAALSIMGKVIYFASSSIVFVLFPIVAERNATGKSAKKLIYLSLLFVGCVSLFITIGYALFPQFALLLLFGHAYDQAAQYVGMFGIFMVAFCLDNVLLTALLGLGKTRVAWFGISAAVIQILSIYIWHGSIFEVIYVNIVVSFALFIALLLYYRHESASI